MQAASPATSSPYIAGGSLKEGSALIMVYFTIRALVLKLASSLESPREHQKY